VVAAPTNPSRLSFVRQTSLVNERFEPPVRHGDIQARHGDRVYLFGDRLSLFRGQLWWVSWTSPLWGVGEGGLLPGEVGETSLMWEGRSGDEAGVVKEKAIKTVGVV
jgi:hypothetical protein